MHFDFTPFRLLPQLCLILMIAIPMSFADGSKESSPHMSKYQWKNRVLLVAASNEKDNQYREQAAALMSVYLGLLERDLIVLTRFGHPDFSITLIGKDGGVKLKRDEILSTAELFAVIDAMPMRRTEMGNERD